MKTPFNDIISREKCSHNQKDTEVSTDDTAITAKQFDSLEG